MKLKFVFITFFLPAWLFAQHENHAGAGADSTKKSIPKEVHVQLGEAHMMIHYHAPAVRGRMIWGGLVPFNEVWVTGAHSATSFDFNKDIVIDGKIIPQGKYAIFTIPGKEKWIFILNKKWEQHLADEYDAKDDVIRFVVTPTIHGSTQERLNYRIVQKSGTAGSIIIRWEKVGIEVPFLVK